MAPITVPQTICSFAVGFVVSYVLITLLYYTRTDERGKAAIRTFYAKRLHTVLSAITTIRQYPKWWMAPLVTLPDTVLGGGLSREGPRDRRSDGATTMGANVAKLDRMAVIAVTLKDLGGIAQTRPETRIKRCDRCGEAVALTSASIQALAMRPSMKILCTGCFAVLVPDANLGALTKKAEKTILADLKVAEPKETGGAG